MVARIAVGAGASVKSPSLGSDKCPRAGSHSVSGRSASAVTKLTTEGSLRLVSSSSVTGGTAHLIGITPHSTCCSKPCCVTRYGYATGGVGSYHVVASAGAASIGVYQFLEVRCGEGFGW